MPTKPKQNSKSAFVKVGIHNGNLTCTPAVLHVRRNMDIVFSSKSGEPFTIQSKGLSPFDKAEFRSAQGKTTATVRADAEPGAYSFACALYADDQIYMDAACPSVIVDL